MENVFNSALQFKLIVSNPILPRLYSTPKIHKVGEKHRVIVSNINSPYEKLSKWLLSELNCLIVKICQFLHQKFSITG